MNKVVYVSKFHIEQREGAKTSGFLYPQYIDVRRAGVPPGENLGAQGRRDNLDRTGVGGGNRAIFGAHRILAKHRSRKGRSSRQVLHRSQDLCRLTKKRYYS
jgi:hypothetical protein